MNFLLAILLPLFIFSTPSQAQEVNLLSGLYVTSSNRCDFNLAKDQNQLILEATSTLGKSPCLEAGQIYRFQKNASNIYQVVVAEDKKCVLNILGDQNFVIECTGPNFHEENFFKLFETPTLKPTAKGSETDIVTQWKMNTPQEQITAFYQAVAGIGSCRLILCKNGTLDYAMYASGKKWHGCEESTSGKINHSMPKAKEKLEELLYVAGVLGGCDE